MGRVNMKMNYQDTHYERVYITNLPRVWNTSIFISAVKIRRKLHKHEIVQWRGKTILDNFSNCKQMLAEMNDFQPSSQQPL